MENPPMKIDEVLDDVVLLGSMILSDINSNKIEKNKIYVKVVGYDEYGMWVDHPSFQVPTIKDGQPVGEKEVSASMLIPWGFIASVVHFPGVEGFDFPNPFEAHIGFDIKNK